MSSDSMSSDLMSSRITLKRSTQQRSQRSTLFLWLGWLFLIGPFGCLTKLDWLICWHPFLIGSPLWLTDPRSNDTRCSLLGAALGTFYDDWRIIRLPRSLLTSFWVRILTIIDSLLAGARVMLPRRILLVCCTGLLILFFVLPDGAVPYLFAIHVILTGIPK